MESYIWTAGRRTAHRVPSSLWRDESSKRVVFLTLFQLLLAAPLGVWGAAGAVSVPCMARNWKSFVIFEQNFVYTNFTHFYEQNWCIRFVLSKTRHFLTSGAQQRGVGAISFIKMSKIKCKLVFAWLEIENPSCFLTFFGGRVLKTRGFLTSAAHLVEKTQCFVSAGSSKCVK